MPLVYKNLTRIPYGKQGQKKTRVTTTCHCGKEFEVELSNLKSGRTKSCGCNRIKHGGFGTRIYSTYTSMVSRCKGKKQIRNKNYGKRGIKVCPEWLESFEVFRGWALKNGYTDELTIDRIDNNGNYEPTNCKWSTCSEQAGNTRRNILYKGECASVASRRLGGADGMVVGRLRRGWLKEKAFTTPSTRLR